MLTYKPNQLQNSSFLSIVSIASFGIILAILAMACNLSLSHMKLHRGVSLLRRVLESSIELPPW